MTKKGRPKGTHVVQCTCGRRTTGALGAKVKCPDCKKSLTVKPVKTRGKRFPVLLKGT